jgi:hypothetical protein
MRAMARTMSRRDGVQITPTMSLRRAVPTACRRLTLVGLLCAAGCRDKATPPARVDSVANARPADPPVPIDWRGWPSAAGGVLAVAPEDDPSIALLVRPDAERAQGTDTLWQGRLAAGDSIELLALDGQRLRTAINPLPSNAAVEQCEEWPAARVGTTGLDRWGVGFAPGRVAPIAARSIDRLGAADSAQAAAVAARIVAATAEAGRSQLAGLPFTVERWHELALAVAQSDSTRERFGDTTLVVATLFRRLAQEADPREERWFVVAERIGRARSAPWLVRYLEFHEAREDGSDAIALLGAVRVTDTGQPALVVARDGAEGLVLRWLAPRADGDWRATWTSARARCRSE